jgi:hypothetical protein
MVYNYNDFHGKNFTFVTEGIFDAARIMSWNLHGVCVFGANMSPEQASIFADLEKFNEGPDEVVICFDNGAEKKARSAALKIDGFVGDDLYVSVMDIEKEGADPDEITKDEFLDYFSNRSFVSKKNDVEKASEKMKRIQARLE